MISNSEDLEIKIKEFGKPLFKSKGKKRKVLDETNDFLKLKW